jgi:hypothetical protein
MKFEIPNKQILSPEQLVAFQASAAHAEIEAYVQALNEAVVGVKLTDLPAHSVVRELCPLYHYQWLSVCLC